MRHFFSTTDLREAVRGLRRAPTVAVCAVLCLALGLGATAAIASAIDRALLRQLPFRDPAQLVTVYRTGPQVNSLPFSAPKYLDLARGVRQLSGLAAFTGYPVAVLALSDGGVQVRTPRVTGNLFALLGVRPLRGRLITPADDSAGHDPVAVLSAELWRDRFAADPALVGRTIHLDGIPRTVIGILPAGFRVPYGSREISGDVWVPMRFTPDELQRRGWNHIEALGRLAPGATVRSASAELRSLVDSMVVVHPELRGESARAVGLKADSVRTVRTPLLLIFGAVCAVMLIAAANVGSLLLARSVRRQREMAVRVALGASRWAVMRPALAEGLVLSAGGGLLGIGLAWLAVRTIGALAATRLPQLAGLAIEVRVVLFALALAAIVALLCSALPAWHSATIDPQDALGGGRGGGAGRAQQRALAGLVMAEVGLSLVLLIGASLVLRGFETLVRRDPGFDPQPLLTLDVTISPERYGDTAGVRRFLLPVIGSIAQLPGVASAGAISDLPYREWGDNSNIRYEGQPSNDPEHEPLADDRSATPGFFRAMGQRLLAGRLLRADDDARQGVPLVVDVNEALVRRDFPHEDPVGKRFYVNDTTFATIVGVVSDIPNAGPIDPPVPEVYWSYAEGYGSGTEFPLVIRARAGDPAALEGSVRAVIHAADPTAAVAEMMPMRAVMAKSIGEPRFYLWLLATFALVAVALAMAGLYGVMSYSVAQRTRELGIRTALGSSRAVTLRTVTAQGMRLVAIGVVGGVIGGALATRLLQSLLYGVSRTDVGTWLAAIAALTAAGAVAAFIPAARATRVDPVIAIRVDG